MRKRGLLILFVLLALAAGLSTAQDRLKTYPGYEQYQKMSKEMQGAMKSGALQVKWADDGKSFTYNRDGKSWKYNLAARKAIETRKPVV